MTDIVNAETARFIATLATTGLEPKGLGLSTHLIVPPNFTAKDMTEIIEKAQGVPNRKRGTAQLLDVDSLIRYCLDQANAATGYLYADPDARTITAVFNDNAMTGVAGWRDHRAHFAALYTDEFAKWLKLSDTEFSQTDFAEFLEDNIADLVGDEAANLLRVASTIQATTGINFFSAKRLQDGQTQLTYNENIEAKAGADGSMAIPKTFTLGLRIFKNGGGYTLTARLKFRLAGAGGIKFRYELERPELAVEDAFKGYVDVVREKSGYTVLVGKA